MRFATDKQEKYTEKLTCMMGEEADDDENGFLITRSSRYENYFLS